MRFWDLAESEVEAVDAQPWDGPLAGMVRPISVSSMLRVGVVSMLLLSLSGCAGLVLAFLSPSAARDAELFVAFNVAALALAASQGAVILALPLRSVRRLFPLVAVAGFVATPILVTVGFASAGPPLGIVAVSYIQGPLLAFYLLRTRWAIVYCLVMLAGVGFVLHSVGEWAAPLGMWIYIAANVVATAVLIGQITAMLSDRVTAQVAEIGRLNGLRRFLSPQVADAVLSGHAENVTQPHRRRIAVLFCDLRGFTAFTNGAEPEEVIAILGEYYQAVGGVLHRHGATIGDYAGDGIMAYLGDPVPRDDAALATVAMTREIVTAMSDLTADWKRRGYELDYGIGLAVGYATLGVVGFDGRYDYTPIGGVVNLAARLCAKARPSQVLLDHAAHVETAAAYPSQRLADLELKGYGKPQRVYALV